MALNNLVLNALVYCALVTIYSFGISTIPIYIIIGLMAYNTFMVVVASSASVFGFVNPQDSVEELKKESKFPTDTKLMTFMVHIIQGVSIYSVYVSGFVFASGIFATTLSVMFLGNILRAIKGVNA